MSFDNDEDGKIPLHFACDSSGELFEDDAVLAWPTSRATTPNHESIRALLFEKRWSRELSIGVSRKIRLIGTMNMKVEVQNPHLSYN
jgi:hypothetical protein